jgi:hypothetical protein
VSTTCAHCDSLLLLSAPGRDEIYIAEEVVGGKHDLEEMVVEYRVRAQRAELIDRHKDGDGNPPSEVFLQRRLAAYERLLRETVKVLDCHRVQVPYWHLTGRIVQCVLGRRGDGPKQVRVRAFSVEHTVPAYDPARANLRDRGLRLSASRVRPLTVDGVRQRGPFLPSVPVTPQSYREIDRWKGQDLEAGLEAVTRHGEFLASRRLLVYRAYWLARISTDKGMEWLIADGSFATIAGYPDEAEVAALLRLAGGDPLRSGGESYRRVSIAASRCPDCGFEARLDPTSSVVVCANCHLGLGPETTGIRLFPYDHALAEGRDALDAEFLPFWRYEVTITVPGRPPFASLEEYAGHLFPQGLPRGFALRGRHLWVPAFRLLGTEHGDETFQALVQAAHAQPWEVASGKIPLGGRSLTWGASVSEAEARELARVVLFGMYGPAAAARLNTRLVNAAIEKATLALAAPRLVFAPFARDGEVLRTQSVRVPLLLLRGGRELEAQRWTVHRARAALQREGG